MPSHAGSITCAEDVAQRLDKPKKINGGWIACCPAHPDKTPSLGISDGDKGIVVKCYAGCDQEAVISALKNIGAWPEPEKKTQKKKRRIVKEYNYTDEDGVLLYQVIRYDPKDFRQRMPDGDGWKWNLGSIKELVPYKLTDIVSSKKGIVIVEGEKDADTLSALGVTATTFARGAGKWRDEYSKWFKDRSVIILPDNDEPGSDHAELVASKLHGTAKSVKIVNLPGLPHKGDVSDWVAAGGSKDDLAELIKAAEEWSQSAQENRPEPAKEVSVLDSDSEILERHGYVSWPDQNDKGRPLGTIANVEKMLEMYGITVRYNAIKKDIDISIPGETFTIDNAKNCSIARVISIANQCRLPVQHIPDFVMYIADKNRYNPVDGWISSKPWDGKDRFKEIVKTLDAKNEELAAMLLWRWMISAVAAVYNPDGVAAQGVLVLQGPQYIGKTSWFWSLIEGNKDFGKEAHILNPGDKDSVKQAVSYWIVELGELDATFRKSDIAALKGFITKDNDEIRLPYGRSESKFPRRTVYFASVNPKHYLHDDTGNRRFWTIECGPNLNHAHGIDMQQMWAQVKHAYDKGARWYLTRDEVKILNEVNEDYSAIDPIEELILKHYDFNAKLTEEMTGTEVLVSIGYDKPSRKQSLDCSTILRKLTGADSVKKTGGRRVFRMPKKLTRSYAND